MVSFINTDEYLRVPPLSDVRELMHAAQEIEASEEKHVLPSKKWIAQLLYPGTSLGGARPKATVIDDIEDVISAMKSWRNEAKRLLLPQRDIDMFAPRFDKWI